MSPESDEQQDGGTVVYEAAQGRRQAGARDCSDELLPEGEQISDAERAALRAQKPLIRWPKADPAGRRYRPKA